MLSEQQCKCIELMVTGEFTQVEIAEKLQICDQTISNWKKIKEFMDEKEKLMRESFKALVPKAREKMKNLMLYAESEQVQFQATKEVLYISGLKPTDKSENVNVNLDKSIDSMTIEEIEAEIEKLEKK